MQTMTSSALILLPTALDADSDPEQSLPGPVLAQLHRSLILSLRMRSLHVPGLSVARGPNRCRRL